MSDDVTFEGEFCFHDRDCLIRGLAGFVDGMKRHTGIHELGWVRLHGLTVRIDFDGSTPASWYDSMKFSLWALGLYANRGYIDTSYTMEGDTWSESISHGSCTNADDRLKTDPALLDEVKNWLAKEG